jgi:tetratricopeptide (TPR) repeat protein
MVLLAKIRLSSARLAAAFQVCLLAVSAAADTTALEDRTWHDVSSENFRIKSVLGEQRTIELLRHLEVMHLSLGGTSEVPIYESAVPTIILAVDSHDDYVSIGAPHYSAGFFFSDLRENAILIEDSYDSTGIQIILHEYAHYLNKQSGRIRYPRWYEEGNAEYLSHSRLREHAFEYALAPKQHVASLNFASWLPLSRLLEISDTSELDEIEGALFYAQSWLLVHYLRGLPGADHDLPEKLQRYAALVSQRAPHVDAFERAFDLDTDELEGNLLKYFMDKEFTSRTVPANTALPGFSARVRTMTQTEAQLALAQMALRFDNIDGAQRWFEGALKDAELRAHAEAGLGRVLGQRGDVAGANQHFESAIMLMAWDFNIWMDYAQYWAQRVSTSYDPKVRIRNASRLVESLENALTISAATPELNSLMGFAYLAKGEDPIEAIEFLEAAAAAAPHDQASRLLLANAYLHVGRPDDAIDVAESVLQLEHEPNLVTTAAHEIIGEARKKGAR